MSAIGIVFLVVGVIVALIGGIWILVLAFQESALWGLGCLFVPFVTLIFVIMHWDKAGKPFLINLGGAAVMALGVVTGGVGT